MGVDVGTWRCRIGIFVVDHGAGAIIINFSTLMKIIGCVSFVRMLLIMSGIEQNPGPDTFTFRYQYLLVHIGTKVLRELFVVKAGIDVGQFLTAKSKDITQLAAAKVITTTQKQMLLPVNNQPHVADFDITLLSCLLRNVCGLCHPKATVWTKPAPTDTCIEADIARLRICRNELMHSDKLRLPDAELKIKWTELNTILTRLNTIAGIPQLQKLIHDAEHMDVDEGLRNEHNETLKAWEEQDKIVDRGIAEFKDEVKHEFTEVKKQLDHGHTELMSEFTEVKKQVDYGNTGLISEFTEVKKQVDHGNTKLMSEFTEVKKQLDHGNTELISEFTEVKKQVGYRNTELISEVLNVKHELTEVKKQLENATLSPLDYEYAELISDVSNVKHELTEVKKQLEDATLSSEDYGYTEVVPLM